VWLVLFHPDFKAEFLDFPASVQAELLAQAGLLERVGPQLGRSRVDTLKGSAFANMKELRFDAVVESGGLPSPSIPSEEPFCSWVAINLESANDASTGH
jgi:hypothetical protein